MTKQKDKKIKDLEKEIKKLRKIVHYDELTGLLNRRGFKESIATIFNEVLFYKKGKREKRKSIFIKDFSILFIDVDGLKRVNDLYGHKKGDQILIMTAEAIKKNTRETDFLARWGGDEFIAGLLGASESDSFRIAENIRKFLSKKVTLSIGIATLNSKYSLNEGLDQIISHADKAMYVAKHKRGRNNTVKHSEIG
ncbi:GGDEF domain-containing protein [Patescibacteria group bacterium]|nr:GGDEF domain-containing protein [Patescibacteria group bacterium]